MPKHCTNKTELWSKGMGLVRMYVNSVCTSCDGLGHKRHNQNQPKTFTLFCSYSDRHLHNHKKTPKTSEQNGSVWVHLVSTKL